MIAAFIIYHLALGLMAGVVAWGLERLAIVLRWPRRGLWAAAVLATLLVPIGIMLNVSTEESAAPVLLQPAFTFEAPLLPSLQRAPSPSIERSPAMAQPGLPARSSSATIENRWPVLRAPVLPEWGKVLLVCWIALSLLSASALLLASRHLSRRIRGLPAQQVDGVTVRVAESMGPAVFGWFKPQIVLPRWLLDSTAHCTTVLAHERSHAEAHDSLLFNLSLVTFTLTPWNPVLWWLVRRLRIAIEVDCDRRVLRAGLDALTYVQALLQVARLNKHTTFGAPALVGAVSQLGTRVHAMTVELSRPLRIRLVASALGAIAASAVVAAQVEPPAVVTTQQAEEKLARDVRSILLGGVGGPVVGMYQGNTLSRGAGPGSPSAQAAELQQAMNDPELRRRLLEEQRRVVERYNPDLIEVLKVDEQTGERLLDLLAEQSLRGRMSGLENLSRQLEASRQAPQGAPRSPPRSDPGSIVGGLAEERRAIKDVLGEAAFGRYLDYLPTVRARFDVIRLASRLDAEPFTSAQREQMVTVMLDEIRQEREQRLLTYMPANDTQDALSRRNTPPTRGLGMSPQQTQQLLKGREQTLERMVEREERLLKAAAPILSPSQLAALSKLESDRIAVERRSIEELSQALAEYESTTGSVLPSVDAEPPAKQRLAGQLRWSMEVTVNGSAPQSFAFAGALGTPVGVKLTSKLFVEAIPLASDKQRFVVDMKVYEIDAAGTRYVIEQVQPVFSFTDPSAPRAGSDRKFDIIPVGSEPYAISFSISGTLQ